MRFAVGISLLAGIWGGLAVADISVPSGQRVSHVETLIDGDTVRFRFLAPDIDPAEMGLGYSDVEGDFAVLCEDIGLPILRDLQMENAGVVISLMSAPTEFGVANPEVIQFFEGFSVENATCIWEQF